VSTLAAAVETFAARLSQVSLTLLVLAVLLQVANLLLRATAWRAVLAAAMPNQHVRWRGVTGAYLAGTGVNSVLPARGGDVARVVLVSRTIPGSCCTLIASGLLVETLLDGVIGGGLVTWAVWSGAMPLQLLERRPPGGGGVVVVIAAALAGTAFVAAGRAHRSMLRIARNLRRGLAILTMPRIYLRTVAGPQIAAWVARVAAMYVFLQAFQIHAGLGQAALALLAGSLTTVVPLTPGGVGTQQALLVVLLSGVASPAAAVSFGLGTQLVTTVVNVALGGTCMGMMLGTMPWRARMALPPEPEPVPVPLPVSTSGE
jgi:uncharacterized membrane protein YbhN (UPF0104 family)